MSKSSNAPPNDSSLMPNYRSFVNAIGTNVLTEDTSERAINHPAHYASDADDIYEAIKVIEAWNADFCIGNVLKYLCRAGRKPGETTLRDLQKAAWYLNRHIEQEQKQ